MLMRAHVASFATLVWGPRCGLLLILLSTLLHTLQAFGYAIDCPRLSSLHPIWWPAQMANVLSASCCAPYMVACTRCEGKHGLGVGQGWGLAWAPVSNQLRTASTTTRQQAWQTAIPAP